MTLKTWVAALAPTHLAQHLADDLTSAPAYTAIGGTRTQVGLHHTAVHSLDWAKLTPIASAIDLHPATAAVLLERAKKPGMFGLAVTLLLAGHADKLAPLVGERVSLSGSDYPDHRSRTKLTSWFEQVAIDWDDLLAALGSCTADIRTLILSAYLASDQPHGELLDKITSTAPALADELDELLLTVDCWDERTATRLAKMPPPLHDGAYPMDRLHSDRQRPHIPDLATWAALSHEHGCERLAFAVSGAGHYQDVPPVVVPTLVKLGRAYSPALMWSLLAARVNLLVPTNSAELAYLVTHHGHLLEASRRVSEATPRGGYVLAHYGHLMDEPTKLAVMATGGLGDLACWCVDGALSAGDVPALVVTLHGLHREIHHLLLRGEVHGCDWEQVAANPLLLTLMLEDPTYLGILHRGASEAGCPAWASRLHLAFRDWVRPLMGDDPAVWRTFSTLMANPGELTTSELVTTALAVNTPARR